MSRERILEWLQSIPSGAHPHHLPEHDRGLISDPDTSQANTSTTSQQQREFTQKQCEEECQQTHKSQRLHHRLPSPAMHRQTRISTPVILTSSQQSTARALSISSLQSISKTDASISAQLHDHLTLHRRQKSESPLPEVPSVPELPSFTPKRPALPGNRVPKQPLRSDASDPLPQSVLKHSSSVQEYPRRVLLSLHHSSPSSLHKMKKVFSVTEPSLSELTSREPNLHLLGQKHGEEVLTDVVSLSCSPDSTEPISASENDAGQRRLESESLSTPTACDKLFTLAPSESLAPPTDDTLLQTAATTLDSSEDPCAPLSSVELATLSLQVLDILPQLAIYLGIDYSEYESVTAEEPSPQRQSMAVLMHWHRHSSSPSRRELAHALQQSGEGYSKIAQQLLRGKLVESDLTFHDLEEEVSPRKLVASPTPVSHHHSSPSPLPPTSSQLSPEHKHPVASLPPSSTPPLYLTARTSKLKQGFIFDEDRISSDSLPKFLSNRRDWRKTSLPVQVAEREDSSRECAEREELARPTVGDAGVREVGFRKSEPADYRRASGPALLRSLQKTESQLLPRRIVQLQPSLNPPSSTAARSSLYPRSSPFMLRENSIGREKQVITKTNTSSVGQKTQPPHQLHGKDGGVGQPIKRQDSGIETLTSSSVTHL